MKRDKMRKGRFHFQIINGSSPDDKDVRFTTKALEFKVGLLRSIPRQVYGFVVYGG